MQEQMHSMKDSGDFQDVESNYSVRLFYGPRQPAGIPSSRSMLCCDKRLPLDTWNISGLQENVFGAQFPTFDTHRDHPQGIHPCAPQRERGSVPQATGSGTLFARHDKQNRDTIPMPTCAGRPSTMSSVILVKFPRNCMVGQQRQQISELQFDTFTNPQSFSVWKIRFKNPETTCSDFPSDAMLWIKSPRDQFVERIFQFSRCWTRNLLLLWTRSSRIPSSKRRPAWRSRKFQNGLVSTREDRSHSLFMMIISRNSIQNGTKFYYQCPKVPPMISWKVCTNWGYASLMNSKPYWNCTTRRFLRIYRCPIMKNIEDNGEEKYRSETSITKLWRQARENRNRSSGQESKGNKWRLRRKRYLSPVERQRPVFEGRPVQFPAWE